MCVGVYENKEKKGTLVGVFLRLIPGFCRSPVVIHTVGAREREREKGVTTSSQFTLPVPSLATHTSPRIIIYMYGFKFDCCLSVSRFQLSLKTKQINYKIFKNNKKENSFSTFRSQ